MLGMNIEQINQLVSKHVMKDHEERYGYVREYAADLRMAFLVVEKMRNLSDGHFTLLAFTTDGSSATHPRMAYVGTHSGCARADRAGSTSRYAELITGS